MPNRTFAGNLRSEFGSKSIEIITASSAHRNSLSGQLENVNYSFGWCFLYPKEHSSDKWKIEEKKKQIRTPQSLRKCKQLLFSIRYCTATKPNLNLFEKQTRPIVSSEFSIARNVTHQPHIGRKSHLPEIYAICTRISVDWISSTFAFYMFYILRRIPYFGELNQLHVPIYRFTGFSVEWVSECE